MLFCVVELLTFIIVGLMSCLLVVFERCRVSLHIKQVLDGASMLLILLKRRMEDNILYTKTAEREDILLLKVLHRACFILPRACARVILFDIFLTFLWFMGCIEFSHAF